MRRALHAATALAQLLHACYCSGLARAATNAAFTHSAVSAALQPWAALERRVSEEMMTARLAEVVAGGNASQTHKRILGVILHAGEAWITTGPLMVEQMYKTPFLRLLHDAAEVAAANPQLSAELLLHFGDSQVNNDDKELSQRVPVFAVDRWVRAQHLHRIFFRKSD